MPKVHTAKAAKDYPQYGIKKGDLYYYWSPYRSKKRSMSKTMPKPSQLTQSDFLQSLYSIQEEIDAARENWTTIEDAQGFRDTTVENLETLRDETQEKRENMPEGLQEVGSGELLGTRCDQLQEAIDGLNNIDIDEPGEEEDLEEYLDEVHRQMTEDVSLDIE